MIRRTIFAIAMSAVLWAPPLAATACPLCKDAISTNDADEDVNNLPAAYNNSIYLMLTVPYLCLGVVSFLVYRSFNAQPPFEDGDKN